MLIQNHLRCIINSAPVITISQVLRTLTYYNNKSEPSGQLDRLLTIHLSDLRFQPCSIDIAVLNTPDAPIIHLPDGYVFIAFFN